MCTRNKELELSSQKYHPKASVSLHDSLAALVRHSQAQKCLQNNSKPFQKFLRNFKTILLTGVYADWLTN